MRALVLGGTGPTGPLIVNGLLARGYRVTILHGGFHEVEFHASVEHLHGDVHFAESLAATLGGRTFDLVVAMYGRLRETAEFMVGRTGRLVAISTAAAIAGPNDARWGPMGRPAFVSDAERVPPDPAGRGLLSRVQAANDRLMELAGAGHYAATVVGYSILYGPRQVAPEEWCVVRRVLDGRRELVVADGGLKVQQRTYVDHAAQAVLIVIDRPDETAGRYFAVGEQPLYTIRQRIEQIASAMGAELELVDLPYELARPAHYLWGRNPGHAVLDDGAIRTLGFRETVPTAEAIARTVSWLVANRAAHAAEWEEQIDDAFDYAGEDELIRRWRRAREDLSTVLLQTRIPAHRYRLPRTPGERWRRPGPAPDQGGGRGA
jgi:nucleoside-diphosphate-sugar epimerase